MSLGAPWMLLLLPAVVVAGGLMLRARRLQDEAACRLKGVEPDRGPMRLARRDWLVLAALGCIVLALARPRWNPRPTTVERRGRDLVIALDVSRSMLAADVFPSRLEAARIAVLEALPALAGQRIALITFAGSASVKVPLTLDHGFVRYMLERAEASDADLGSTSLQAAFETAADKVLTDATGGRRDLVVFTDGEDHLGDVAKTAERLAGCGARVLIVGLGDPLRGARVPDAADAEQWMRYQGGEVISRLEEGTLAKLAGSGRHVTYYPARTRPFAFLPLYQQLISGTAADVVVGQLRHVRYTEGYPLLLAAALALWLAASPLRLPGARPLVLILVLLPGCGRRAEDAGEAAFQARAARGGELLVLAQEQTGSDPAGQRSLLREAREEFLCAALLRPGDVATARRITWITRQLSALEAAIEEQQAAEEQRGEELVRIIERLQRVAVRQSRLAQQSQQILRRYPPPPPQQLNRLAAPLSTEQEAVQRQTAGVRDRVVSQQEVLRELLTQAYGDIGRPPATELDPVADRLDESLAAQQRALAELDADPVPWPSINTAFHTSAGRLQQALEGLRSLQPPSPDDPDAGRPMRNPGEGGELREGPESEDRRKGSPAMAAGDFKEALSLQSLPVPNFTSAEILAEEAANQQQRAQRRAARAGAQVEKNW